MAKWVFDFLSLWHSGVLLGSFSLLFDGALVFRDPDNSAPFTTPSLPLLFFVSPSPYNTPPENFPSTTEPLNMGSPVRIWTTFRRASFPDLFSLLEYRGDFLISPPSFQFFRSDFQHDQLTRPKISRFPCAEEGLRFFFLGKPQGKFLQLPPAF